MNFTNDSSIMLSFKEESIRRIKEIKTNLADMRSTDKLVRKELIHEIFRSLHSIKAGSNLLDLKIIEKIAHDLESMTEVYRARNIRPAKIKIQYILDNVNQIRNLIDDIKL